MYCGGTNSRRTTTPLHPVSLRTDISMSSNLPLETGICLVAVLTNVLKFELKACVVVIEGKVHALHEFCPDPLPLLSDLDGEFSLNVTLCEGELALFPA